MFSNLKRKHTHTQCNAWCLESGWVETRVPMKRIMLMSGELGWLFLAGLDVESRAGSF